MPYIVVFTRWPSDKIPEVIKKVQDRQFRNKIVKNAYDELVLSKKYRYSTFVSQVESHILSLSKHQSSQIKSVDTRSILPYVDSVLLNVYLILNSFLIKLIVLISTTRSKIGKLTYNLLLLSVRLKLTPIVRINKLKAQIKRKTARFYSG